MAMVCDRLKNERKRLGMTQPDLAKICSVSVQTVVRWEKEVNSIPTDKLVLLAGCGFDICFILLDTNKIGDLSHLDAREKSLLDNYRHSSDKNKTLLLDMAEIFSTVSKLTGM